MAQAKTPPNHDATAESVTAQVQQLLAAIAHVPERPALAPSVRLAGELEGTGFEDRQWLIERDGSFIQVTELLYRIAEQVNGERTLDEIATEVTASTEWLVTADHVRRLIETKLAPLGLIAAADGSAPANSGTSADKLLGSPLALNFRLKMFSPQTVDPVIRVLQVLHNPFAVVVLLGAAALVHEWLYIAHGLVEPLRALLYQPGALLVTLAALFVAAVFHEFGHASALRYGGGQVRGMGIGLYTLYPALYTDVTDSYRLGRWARVRTDLGGFYFSTLFTLVFAALYALTGQEYLLMAIPLINLDIIYQCLPFVRLDGYWLFADLTGIPDFFSQMGPFLRSVSPVRGTSGSKLPRLKPFVKVVFTAYIALTVPVLALLTFLMVRSAPNVATMVWDVTHVQLGIISQALSTGNLLTETVTIAVTGTQILLNALMLFGILYMLLIMARSLVRRLWRWSAPTPARRVAAAAIFAALVAFVAYLWAPYLSVL